MAQRPLPINEIFRDLTIIITTGVITTLMVRNFYCTSEETNRMNITALIFMISAGIAYCGDLTSRLTGIWNIHLIYYLGVNIAIISLYILTLSRLYYSFADSTYRIKKSIIYMHICNMFLLELTWISTSILDYFQLFPLNTIAAVTSVIVFLSGYCHIVYIFNRNLFQLVLVQRSTIIQLQGDNNDKIIELNTRQKCVLKAVVKQTVLTCWLCLIMSVYVLSFIITVIIDPNQKHDGILIFQRWTIAIMINGVAITLSLTFSFTQDLYERICIKCDSKCDKICQHKASRRIMKQMELSLGDIIMSTSSNNVQSLPSPKSPSSFVD